MIERSQWGSALQALPEAQILSLTKELVSNWQIRPKVIPQAGLGMLKLNDSALCESFYLGEFPLATAWIEVETADGTVAEGAAQIMSDRTEIAEALALCDAVLAAQLPGWEQVAELLAEGVAIRTRIGAERKRILSSTQVDFSLLDEVGGEDA
ncbi:MAG: phosphonate C-P lyase system protein PhnG [Desulfuromonadales bacterium]|nr:phosphonate C-P lyase system protein PhnG [Desulfuromonadales bacterium]